MAGRATDKLAPDHSSPTVIGTPLDLHTLQRLESFTRRLNRSRSVETVLKTLGEASRTLLGADRYAIIQAGTEDGRVRSVSAHVLSPETVATISNLYGDLLQEVADQRLLVIQDVQADPRMASLHDQALVEGLQVILWVALKHQDVTLGALAACYNEPTVFDEQRLFLARLLADLAATAMASALLWEESQRRTDLLLALQRVGTVVTASLELDQVLQSVVDELQRTFDFSLVSIHQVCDERLWLQAIASRHRREDYPSPTRLGEGIIGRVARTGRADYIADVTQDADYMAIVAEVVMEACVPIFLDGEVWGVLNVEASEPARLSPADVPFLEMFSHQIAVAIRNARIFADSRQRVVELEALRDISLQLTSSLDLQSLIESIVASAMKLVQPAAVHLYLYDQDQERFTLGTALWDSGERRPAVASPRPDGITASTMRRREPIIINDALNHPLYGLNPDPVVRAWGVTAIGAFPLSRPGGVVGVLTASFTRPFTFDESVVRLLSLLADQAAIAVENARLFELEASRRELADTLRQLAAAVGSTLDFSQVAATVLEHLERVVPYDTAAVLVLEDDNFRLAAQAGWPVGDTEFWDMMPRQELLASNRVIETGQPLIIPDTTTSEHWHAMPLVSHVRSWLGVPLRFQGEIFGTLCLDNRQPNAYSQADAQVVKTFADQTATALANARLYQAAQRRAEEMQRLREFNERIVQGVEEAILLQDAQDRMIFVNPRFCEMLGYTPEDVLGQDAAILLTPEMIAHVERQAEGRTSGEKGRYEAALLRKDGSQVPVLVSATPVFQSGAYHGTLTVFTDITQRKRTEETLLALNAAATAVRRAVTPRQVYETISEELCRLGLTSAILRFDSTTHSATIEHLVFASEIEELAQPATLAAHQHIHLALDDLPFLKPTIAEGRAIFLANLGEIIADLGNQPIEDWARETLKTRQVGSLDQARQPPDNAPAARAAVPGAGNDGPERRWIHQVLHTQRAITAPLVSQQQIIGLLAVIGQQLSEADVPAVEAFANQASVALDNARLWEAERRERQRAETLSEVARILSSTLDLSDALHQVMAQLRRLIDYDSSSLFLYQEGLFHCYATEGFDDLEAILRITYDPGDNAILAEMMRNPRVVLIGNTFEDPRWQRPPGAEHVACWIGAPLVAEGQLIGVLMADKNEANYYGENDLQVMAAFADQVSVALQRARHYTEAQQRLQELSSLVQASKALNEASELDEVLEVVLAVACGLVNTSNGILALVDETSQTLRVVAAQGQPRDYIDTINRAHLSLPSDLSSGPEVRPGILVNPDRHSGGKPLVTSIVLTVAGQVIGLIELEAPFQQENIRSLLSALADLASVAIERARLYDETRERAARLAVAYEELQELDRMKDEFVQNVSHELRTPLTFVKGYVEYLLEGIAGELNEEQQDALSIVLDRTDAIVRLVNDIISLKRVDTESMTLAPVSLDVVAASCVRGALYTAEQHGVTLLEDYQEPLPRVLGNEGRLGEVFDNLIGNALKFSPDGGIIMVRLSAYEDFVLAEVSDTGIGIPADQLDKIWQRFYQVDGTATRRFGGTGLGLSIVKRIIEAHRGAIWVESTAGKGTTFYFTLPQAPSDDQ